MSANTSDVEALERRQSIMLRYDLGLDIPFLRCWSTFPTTVVALQEDIRILFRILEQLAITDSDTKTRIVMDLVRAYLSIKAFKNPGQMLRDKLDALAEKMPSYKAIFDQVAKDLRPDDPDHRKRVLWPRPPPSKNFLNNLPSTATTEPTPVSSIPPMYVSQDAREGEISALRKTVEQQESEIQHLRRILEQVEARLDRNGL